MKVDIDWINRSIEYLKEQYWFRVVEIIVMILSVWIAIVSYFVAIDSNKKAEDANILAQKANDIATEQRSVEELKFFFDQVRLSSEKSSQIYDQTIWSQNVMNQVFLKIKENQKIESIGNLTRFLNSFEELGQSYCDGIIRDRHVRTQFWKTLDDLCWNKQVIENYKNRNWLAILCKKFAPGRWNWNPSNENKCKTLDSVLNWRRDILEKYWIPFD